MNAFYKKLTKFGSLIHSSSEAKKVDISNYFVVLHPAYPVVKNVDKARPQLAFAAGCPREVKREVSIIWNNVFGE